MRQYEISVIFVKVKVKFEESGGELERSGDQIWSKVLKLKKDLKEKLKRRNVFTIFGKKIDQKQQNWNLLKLQIYWKKFEAFLKIKFHFNFLLTTF